MLVAKNRIEKYSRKIVLPLITDSCVGDFKNGVIHIFYSTIIRQSEISLKSSE
jgi:hypothetical protein